jgi:hypothetical protein
MYIETIIARTEHQLAQSHVYAGIVAEDDYGLFNAIKRLFQRIAASADNGMTWHEWSDWRDNIASSASRRPSAGLR